MPTGISFADFGDERLPLRDVKSRKYPDGKTYYVEPPSVEQFRQWTAISAAGFRLARGEQVTDEDRAALKLDDGDEKSFYDEVLGAAVVAEMTSDGLSAPMLARIGQNVFLYYVNSPEMAAAVLAMEAAQDRGELGNLTAPTNRGQRRARPRKATAPRAARAGSARKPPARKAGSNSAAASGDTPARTRSRTSTPSKRSPTKRAPKAKG